MYHFCLVIVEKVCGCIHVAVGDGVSPVRFVYSCDSLDSVWSNPPTSG